MYLLKFLDRSNLAQARRGSLEEHRGMSGTDSNTPTSIFFVGDLLMHLPSNMIITRGRPSLYLGTGVLLFGLVSTCYAATRQSTDVMVTGFCLGL